jgi:hypothetical protein
MAHRADGDLCVGETPSKLTTTGTSPSRSTQLRNTVRPREIVSRTRRPSAGGNIMRASGHSSRLTPAKVLACSHTRAAGDRRQLAIVKE